MRFFSTLWCRLGINLKESNKKNKTNEIGKKFIKKKEKKKKDKK